MADSPNTKVVLKQAELRPSSDPNVMQRVATVYIDGIEYRVSAPPEAEGNALDWVSHFKVRQLVAANTEAEIHDTFASLALQLVEQELQSRNRSVKKVAGLHPDGIHCDAKICVKGHVQSCDGTPSVGKFCTKCGKACISECPHCGEQIRGVGRYSDPTSYVRPEFCHGCGLAYPWMETTLKTVRELLDHDKKLTADERDSIFGVFRDVLSDPKGEHVAAKKKLLDIKLEKAAAYGRELIVEIIAKTTAEVLKG